jgi:AbrB family looped-hinge helix DNA binding protein
MRVTSKGQVTIPQEIREQLGIYPGCEVQFRIEGDGVRITKLNDGGRGRTLVERMSTDEIMALTRGEGE